MKTRFISLGLVLALCAPLAAFQVQRTYSALTVDATAGGVSIATATLGGSDGIPQMNYCEGRLETAQVRFTDDGTAPTASVGTILEVGDVWIAYSHETAKATKFFRTGSTSGSLKVRCYVDAPQGGQ